MQKSCTCFHRPQDAALAFGPQRFLWDAFSLGNPADERLRLMGIEVIHKDAPSGCCWIAGNETLQVSEAVGFIAGGSESWLNDLACDDIEIKKPRECAMPEILKFAPQHMACGHQQIGMQALQRLHSCQLIHADGPLSLLRPFLRREIEGTSLMNLPLALRIGDFR